LLFGTKDPLLGMQRASLIGQQACTHMVPTEKTKCAVAF